MMRIDSLEYNYQDGTKALKNIDFDLDRGNTIGIIGANGSGKSTLFLNILGLLKPSRGSIEYKDSPLKYDKKSLREYRKEVTMIFQDPEKQLFYSRVYDDVAFALRNLDFDEVEIKTTVDESLNTVRALYLKDKPTHFLSYGQKKRVAIAGTLVLDSKVLLLDEPTSGLDPYMTKEMKNIIKELNKEKKLVISSHDMDFIYEICDYVYVLGGGEVLGEGKPDHVFLETQLLEEALLDKPWLVKVHERLGLPLCRDEEELFTQYGLKRS